MQKQKLERGCLCMLCDRVDFIRRRHGETRKGSRLKFRVNSRSTANSGVLGWSPRGGGRNFGSLGSSTRSLDSVDHLGMARAGIRLNTVLCEASHRVISVAARESVKL